MTYLVSIPIIGSSVHWSASFNITIFQYRRWAYTYDYRWILYILQFLPDAPDWTIFCLNGNHDQTMRSPLNSHIIFPKRIILVAQIPVLGRLLERFTDSNHLSIFTYLYLSPFIRVCVHMIPFFSNRRSLWDGGNMYAYGAAPTAL